MIIGVGLDGRLGLDLGELDVVGREAATLGFESLWTPATGVPDSFHICGQWGEGTAEVTGSAIRTGISVVPAPRQWHPVSLAVQAATVSLRTNGNFVLGIGTGGAGPEHFAASGFPNRPIAVMRDYLNVLRGLLSGERIDYEGPALRIKNASIGRDFQPVPVYLAALGPQMLRLAGEAADGVCLNWASPDQIALSRRQIAAGAEASGRDAEDVLVSMYIRICVDEDVDAARHALSLQVLGYAMARPGVDPSLAYRGHFGRMGFEEELPRPRGPPRQGRHAGPPCRPRLRRDAPRGRLLRPPKGRSRGLLEALGGPRRDDRAHHHRSAWHGAGDRDDGSAHAQVDSSGRVSVIGVLHPGEMGAGIAGALVRSGHRVLWASTGRSAESRERAAHVGLLDAGGMSDLVAASEIVLSICPPHAAVDLAREVAGFTGLFVDANAISPSHAAEVSAIVEAGGADYVDGGIIGSPPPSDTTRLYLSGGRAHEVAALFSTGEVATRLLDQGGTAASAIKMAYGAWTKGTAAMMLDIRAMAAANGVEEALVAEWGSNTPELIATGRRAARQAEDRGWRWVGEMAEIAATFTEAGLPDGFHVASGEVYSRVPRKMDATADDATLREVVALLLAKP